MHLSTPRSSATANSIFSSITPAGQRSCSMTKLLPMRSSKRRSMSMLNVVVTKYDATFEAIRGRQCHQRHWIAGVRQVGSSVAYAMTKIALNLTNCLPRCRGRCSECNCPRAGWPRGPTTGMTSAMISSTAPLGRSATMTARVDARATALKVRDRSRARGRRRNRFNPISLLSPSDPDRLGRADHSPAISR